MMKKSIFILLLLATLTVFGQNSTSSIYYTNGDVKIFNKISLFSNSLGLVETIEATKLNNDKIKISIEGINKIKIKESTYIVKNFNEKTYLFEQIIEGNLSLYKSGSRYFLENIEYGFREIQKMQAQNHELNKFRYGNLSLYINKCKKAQNLAFLRSNSISIKTLKEIIGLYNSCDLSTDIQFADKVIESANVEKESIKFGVSVGYNFMNFSFDAFSENSSKKISAPSIGANIYFNTNLINKKLGFNLGVNYNFSKKFIIEQENTMLYSDLKYISIMGGMTYTFNDLSSKFQPYIGAKGGIALFSMSEVKTKGSNITTNGSTFKPSNQFPYYIGAGSFVKFGEQKIDISIYYQPKIEIGLHEENSSLSIDNNYSYTLSAIELKVVYIF